MAKTIRPQLSPETLKKIEEICHRALDQPVGKRPLFLQDVCGNDPELLTEVQSLLKFAATGSSVIDTLPADVAAELFAKKNDRKIIGTRIRHYKIISQIGSGGMGDVFLAQDLRLERRIAIKFISTEFAQDKDRLRRFINEAKTASALNHPNIITVHEIGRSKSTPFIATEFIDGSTLRRAIVERSLTLAEILDVTLQTAAALNAAHSAGIFHRDIKPENIMRRGDGLVKILDFGLAKLAGGVGESSEKNRDQKHAAPKSAGQNPQLTNSGLLMGTLAYMSPEQAAGKQTNAAGDIWSLGVVLFEMYAGSQPFKGETSSDVIDSILSANLPVLNDNAPAQLVRIISKALQKEPSDRYQTALEFSVDVMKLKTTLELETVNAREHLSFVAPERKLTESETLTETAARGSAMSRSDGRGNSARFGDESPETGLSKVTEGNPVGRKVANAGFANVRRPFWGRKALLLGAVVALFSICAVVFWLVGRSPILTDQDTVLIADFDNLTEDAVFSTTLRRSLALQLAQSPFLRIIPDAEIQEALRSLGRDGDVRISREIAREICLRQNVKAFVTGTFSMVSGVYVVTLQVVNAKTGAVMISEQNQADAKERVLDALHEATSRLRQKVGESLASVKAFDVGSDAATTSSLEALRAYSMAMEVYAGGGNKDEAVGSLFQLAIKLDPDFALAHRDLARHQFNIGHKSEAVASITKAFGLRARTSENERLSIESLYYRFGEIDPEKASERGELWKRTFPRNWQPFHFLSDLYFENGQFEKALENGREAIRLNPTFASAYTNPAGALFRLNRFAEAKELYTQALALNLDHLGYHFYLFWIAYFDRDQGGVQSQIKWMRTHDYEHFAFAFEAYHALLQGQWKQSQQYSKQAREAAVKHGEKNLVSQTYTFSAFSAALFGQCGVAKQQASEAMRSWENEVYLADSAFALAICGDESRALKLVNELAARFPRDTVLQQLRIPTVLAAIAMRAGRFPESIERLSSTDQHNGQYLNFAPFVRALTLLRMGNAAEAAARFREINEHPGWFEDMPLVPISYLWEGRALAASGDKIRSRKAYDHFFELWKDADPEIPILIEAKREYLKLK